MKWKICIIAFTSIFLLAMPAGITGCGPDIDPYDYYTSFFCNNLSGAGGYEPFYYTDNLFLYETDEPVDAAHATANEWISYCGGKATRNQAYDFVCRYQYDQLEDLYKNIADHEHQYLADSVKTNPVTQYFLQGKDVQALRYLIFAKKVEPSVAGGWNYWDAPKRDSLQMASLIKEGQQLCAATSSEFVKLRYAYQVTRLALYSGDSKDCIRFYDNMVANNNAKSVLHDLAASLKAGALQRLGRNYEAALLFSRQFSKSTLKRVANYMSFDWCVRRLDGDDRKKCLALCKTNKEKADLLGLFALGSVNNEAETLQKIFALSPGDEILEVLAVREINKIEKNYFSPALGGRQGGIKLYFSWEEEATDAKKDGWQQEAKTLSRFYHTVALDPLTANKGLFEAGAAHLSFMVKDYADANAYLANIRTLHPIQKIIDQAALTQLLVTINDPLVVDSNFELKILPSVKWLHQKAIHESTTNGNNEQWQLTPWHNFYRNFFAEILAKRYHSAKEIGKEALCIGNAESIFRQRYATESFIENKMRTNDLLALNSLLNKPVKNEWEQYLCGNFPVNHNKVKEVIAVSFIRDYDFKAALQWMGSVKNKDLLQLDRNPFGDLLVDNQNDTFSFDQGNFDKVRFIKEMERLMLNEGRKTASAADFYQMATGYYNMTYYGRAWEVIKFERSGSDGYYVPKDALPFEREYYGCFTAEKYFQKAFNAATDKNTQARCLFMMAKCSQKRNEKQPGDGLDAGDSNAFLQFKYNRYFPRLVKDFSQTPFFEEASHRCSYLRDFVHRK